MALNCLALLLLSLVPSGPSRPASQGVMSIVDDPAIRNLVLEGRWAEYGAAVEAALAERISLDLGKKAKRGAVPGKDAVLSAIRDPAGAQSPLLSLIKKALAVATFVTELQTLGPVKAMNAAIQWVEEGLVRRSGIRPQEFPSFFSIISNPERRRLDDAQKRALDGDLSQATSTATSSYSRLLARIAEAL